MRTAINISKLRQGLSKPEFCGGLVCRLEMIVSSGNFLSAVRWGISCCGRVGYGVDVLRPTVCLVVGPVTFSGFTFIFCCASVGGASDSVAFLAWGLVCWWGGGGLVLWLFVRLLGFPVGFLLLQCWVLFAVGYLSLFYLLFCILICVFWGMVH